MSGPKKTAEWIGMTQSHAFEVEIFEDEEQGIFIANINAHTPPLATALRQPGQQPATMNFEEEHKIRNTDPDVLRAQARAYVEGLFGKILQERELPT